MKKLSAWQIVLLVFFWPIGICYLIYWIVKKENPQKSLMTEKAISKQEKQYICEKCGQINTENDIKCIKCGALLATSAGMKNAIEENRALRKESEIILNKESTLIETDFPTVDDKGMKQLKMLDNVRLSGVTKKHDDINPQEIIPYMSFGEEVFFKRIHMGRYPNAILVVNSSDEPLGWIPEDFPYQYDIAARLDNETTVKGCVCDVRGGDDENYYGISIDIYRYEKPRTHKKKKIPTQKEIQDIENKAKRGLKGANDKEYFYETIAIEFENIGDIDNAIKYYELSVSGNFKGTYPYERLAILYRKQKKYDDEIRILEAELKIFSNADYGQATVDKLNKRIEKAESLKAK